MAHLSAANSDPAFLKIQAISVEVNIGGRLPLHIWSVILNCSLSSVLFSNIYSLPNDRSYQFFMDFVVMKIIK